MDLMDLLGSKTRLRILRTLCYDHCYVTQLMKSTEVDGKTLLYNLDLLESNGLVKSYPKGNKKFYRLDREIKLDILPTKNRFKLDIVDIPDKGEYALYGGQRAKGSKYK